MDALSFLIGKKENPAEAAHQATQPKYDQVGSLGQFHPYMANNAINASMSASNGYDLSTLEGQMAHMQSGAMPQYNPYSEQGATPQYNSQLGQFVPAVHTKRYYNPAKVETPEKVAYATIGQPAHGEPGPRVVVSTEQTGQYDIPHVMPSAESASKRKSSWLQPVGMGQVNSYPSMAELLKAQSQTQSNDIKQTKESVPQPRSRYGAAPPKSQTSDGAKSIVTNNPNNPNNPPSRSYGGAYATAGTKHENVQQKATQPTQELIAKALQVGKQPWKRSKFSLLGQGRAGKTAFANALAGRVFEETASTVGINQLTCDVKHVQSGSSGQGEQEWGECEKHTRECEAAVAALMLQQHKDEKSQTTPKVASITAGEGEGGDIRTYMQTISKSTGTAAGTCSTLVAALKSSAPVATSAATPLDGECVMKELAKLKNAESGLLISLFDFGGQEVFDVIHHLFLTRNGVYALVFNMEWLVQEGPEKDKALRFMRKWLSSIAAHTLREGRTAPIVIVGTRLDAVTSPSTHEQISTLLHSELHDSLAWPSVIKNGFGKDRNGRAEQVYFPVDNKSGKAGASMKQLMSVVHGAMDRAEYTHKEVPLTWFKTIDQMSDTKKDCLLLTEVVTTASACGVSEQEVPLLLSFLHDMGHLMWLDEPGLRDVVILDPVLYLVTPATIIICKLAPDAVDATYHHMEVHAECQVKHRWEFDQLVDRGILSAKLLSILWKGYEMHTAMLLQLMVKFGLLVPLRSSAEGAARTYLVPTLLSPAPLAHPELVSWTDKPTAHCYFVFTLVEQLEQSSTLVEGDLVKSGFLPGGMFERIVGKALSWSQDTARGATVTIDSVVLHKDLAILTFGQQRFRLVHCADIHCVRVDVEGSNPVGIQQKLLDFIRRIVHECMGSLFCFTAVQYQADASAVTTNVISTSLQASEMLIPLEKLRGAVTGGSMLTRRGGRPLLTVEEVKSRYGQWLQLHQLRERYDVFISYRWANFDSNDTDPNFNDSRLTEQLFDMFTNYSVGAHSRAVEVFLDRKRLQEGRLFKSDFAAALTHSLIALPVVSVDALQRMLEHSPQTVDNVLLEWIIILESHHAGKVQKVYPVLFGARSSALGAKDKVGNFFADKAKDRLPKVAPTATLAQAAELLRTNGIEPSSKMQTYTVHGVVQELLQFLLCNASDIPAAGLVETLVEKVVNMLGECGAVALDAVQPMSQLTAVASAAPAPVSVAPPVPATTAVTTSRPLKELSVAEVGELMVRCDLEDLQPIFAANKVKGQRLALCETVEELMGGKVGVPDTLTAKELLVLLQEWKETGVPTS